MNDLGPVLLGLCGAAVIIGGLWVLMRVLSREPHLRAKHAVFFALMFLPPAAGVVYIRDDALLRVGLAAMALTFLWASVGTVMRWPGFRHPSPREREGAGMKSRRPRGSFYDVRTIDVALPRLSPDSAETCPVSREEIVAYAETEAYDGSGVQLSELVFVRTARIGQAQYWIWTFNDPGCGDGYVVVGLWPEGQVVVACDDTFEMTPEQYLVASHFRIEG